MAAHLPRLLQAADVSRADAVFVGALIGPSQVGARLLQFGYLRKVHPLPPARLAAAMHPLEVAVFALLGAPAAAVFGILGRQRHPDHRRAPSPWSSLDRRATATGKGY